MVRVAFATCVQLGFSCIEAIYDMGGSLELLVTLNDDEAKGKSGRIYLDSIAEKHNAPLLKTKNINDPEVIGTLKAHRIDWLFIIGWSQIAKPELLAAPAYGCIGMHPTLLPAGRGRAAIPWAILKGLEKTGVTLFRMDEGVDTGDIIGQGVIELHNGMTATELYRKVVAMHVELIRRYWTDIVNGNVTLTKQNEADATKWPGRKPEDGEITGIMTMAEADRMVRAVTHPYPGAFFKAGNHIIRVWSATTDAADGMFKLADGYLVPLDYELEA